MHLPSPRWAPQLPHLPPSISALTVALREARPAFSVTHWWGLSTGDLNKDKHAGACVSFTRGRPEPRYSSCTEMPGEMLYWLWDTIVNFITFWEQIKATKHKSKSFVPDVRTKRYGYLISIRDMCFECETLVSLPRWALHFLCAIDVRLLYACSPQMGPRWSSVSFWKRLRCWADFFVVKQGWFFEEEDDTRDLAWNHQEVGGQRGQRQAVAAVPFRTPQGARYLWASSWKCQFWCRKLVFDSIHETWQGENLPVTTTAQTLNTFLYMSSDFSKSTSREPKCPR